MTQRGYRFLRSPVCKLFLSEELLGDRKTAAVSSLCASLNFFYEYAHCFLIKRDIFKWILRFDEKSLNQVKIGDSRNIIPVHLCMVVELLHGYCSLDGKTIDTFSFNCLEPDKDNWDRNKGKQKDSYCQITQPFTSGI